MVPSSLGDSFPKETKQEFSNRSLKEGCVIKCLVNDTKPPKEKRFIVMGISYDKVALGTVYINTEINPNVFPTQELKDLHLPLKAESREYLDHDSFVDCSKIYEKNLSEIKAIIEQTPTCCIGDLSAEDYKVIKDKIKASKNISPHVKKKFGLFL
jgi:hypothetical protein